MRQITGLTADAKQSVKIQDEKGGIVKFTFFYLDNQQSWFFDIEYGDFICKSIRLTNCPNIIRQYREVLPFGFGCKVSDGLEPFFIDDFESGRVMIFLLDRADVDYVEQEVYGKIW